MGFNERDGAILSYRLLYDDGEEEKAVRRHLIRVADQEVTTQAVHSEDTKFCCSYRDTSGYCHHLCVVIDSILFELATGLPRHQAVHMRF